MRSFFSLLFRACLRLFPADFRRVYAAEMAQVFDDRMRDAPTFRALLLGIEELADASLAAGRAHWSATPHLRPAIAGGIAIGLLATLVSLQSAQRRALSADPFPLDSIDFNARDPAGHFTLSIRQGRPVAATIDRVPLPPQSLIYAGDSIRLLGPGGGVVLAVSYDRLRGRIAWEPRPVLCRGRAATCAAYQ